MNDRGFLGCGRRLEALASGGGPHVRAALLGGTARYSPDRDFDTLHVALDLAVDFRRRAVSGSCRTALRAYRGGLRTLEFDAVGLAVSSAEVGGRRVRHRLKGGRLVLTLPRSLKAGERAEALVRYRVVDPQAGLHFVYPGPHNPRNPVQLWSQSQPEEARYWFPCHDSPRQKATSELRVRVPKGFTAVSNGTLVETVHGRRDSTYHWRMSRPHAIYLISLAAGRFSELAEEWDGIPVLYYCEKGREAEARRGFAKTPKAMAFFSRMTGVRYPYEKYAQVAVAEYPGGMENTTCTTQTDAILIDEKAALDNDMDTLVAHELAHQWFGDLVTCRDWSHAWLNESFATYCEVLFQAHDKGQDEADYELYHNAEAYFDEDSRRYRRPIVCDTYKDPWTLFDRHLYEKGCWVLHMLKGEVGDAAWGAALGHYLRKHRDRSVETADLIASFEESTGRNLKPFFDQWVFRAGYPSLRVQYHWDEERGRASLCVLQTQDISDPSPAFRLPLELRFEGRGWTRTFRETLSEKEHVFSYRLPSEPLDLLVDPEHRLLKKLVLHKPQAMWRRQLSRGKSAWNRHEAAWAVAAWGGPDAAPLLERAAREEPFWGAACEIVRALGTARGEDSLRALERLAKHPHPKVRRAAVEALGGLRRPEAAPLLWSLARGDESERVRGEALKGLGALSRPRDLPGLRKGLASRSYRDSVSAGALAGLSAGRSSSSLPLLKAASRPGRGFWHRLQAIRGLADYARLSREVVPWLCGLASDPDERVNLAVLATLGRLEDRRALPALEAATKNANSRLRVYAQEAIARIKAGAK